LLADPRERVRHWFDRLLVDRARDYNASAHRGAVAADARTGDAGILTQIPYPLFDTSLVAGIIRPLAAIPLSSQFSHVDRYARQR
jgi:hypothetical protein